jgi:hypothetical protein
MQYEPNKDKFTSVIAPIVFSSKYETKIKTRGPIPQWEPQKLSGRYSLWLLKIKTGKNMAEFPEARHFIPVIIIPSKVDQSCGYFL